MRYLLFAILAGGLGAQSLTGQNSLGMFEGESDIGPVAHSGSAQYDESTKRYRVSASGANMWAAADEFHFVWKKVMPRDVSITASISILTAAGNAHRKGVLMMRQSLDADSAYVSATLHGDGLASLQSRPEKGGYSYEVQSNVGKPHTLRLSHQGEYAYLWVGDSATNLKFSGGSMRMKWSEPFYIGIGACAHDKDELVDVAFEQVRVDLSVASSKTTRFSTLEVVPFPTGDRRAIYAAQGSLRGPTWGHTGSSLIVSHDGRFERVPMAAGQAPERLEIANTPYPCESFQGVSPDGKHLAITCGEKPSVYVVALDAKVLDAKRITHKIPTIWHAWSPDSKTLLYGLERRGKRDFDSIPAEGGGKEIRITSNGVSGNPEYSRDGKFIYFNSDSANGTMQVWRMPAKGRGTPEQVTSDEFNNWYPHFSPDGQRILLLSCPKEVKGPPEDRYVQLRVYTPETKRFQVVARILIGGRGTVDSPAWSPDGKKIAFVSYQFLPQKQ